MTREKHEKSGEILTLLNVTGKAIIEIEKLSVNGIEDKSEVYIKDRSTYNLCICKHEDGSGINADLSRYWGNEKLLQVILAELKRQQKELEIKFEKL